MTFQILFSTCKFAQNGISHNDLRPENIAIKYTKKVMIPLTKERIIDPSHTHLQYNLNGKKYTLENEFFAQIIDFDVSTIYSNSFNVANQAVEEIVDLYETRQLYPTFRKGFDFVTFIYHFIQSYLFRLQQALKQEVLLIKLTSNF